MRNNGHIPAPTAPADATRSDEALMLELIGDILFNGDGTHLVGTRIGTGVGAATLPSEIGSFNVDDAGRLAAAPGSPFAPQGAGPFGSEFRPTNSSQLFHF
jgi:hypothetical protein